MYCQNILVMVILLCGVKHNKIKARSSDSFATTLHRSYLILNR